MTAPVRQKVMTVFGTRPEAIKLAPVIRALEIDPRFESVVVSTGQHKEMLVPILEWFQITPHHTLSVMEPGQPLAFLSGKLLQGLHTLMEAEQPDVVIVQGDTTTAFMGALTAYYGYDYFVRTEGKSRHHIQIAHVEAGLRTGNLYAPFPEEANRKLIGTLAHWHFAHTETAAQNLFDENITGGVHITGNTVIDALHLAVHLLKTNPRPLPNGVSKDRPYILITGHRRENYGEGFEHICTAIATLAQRYPTHDFLYPVHLNRHVQGPVHHMLGNIPNVHLTAPMDYPDFVNAMQHATLLLTDSGGLQEEGPALGKPVLVMREVTERPEGIQAGTCQLVGTTAERIIQGVSTLLDDPAAYARMANAVNPYGDGAATPRILNLLAGEDPESHQFTPTPLAG